MLKILYIERDLFDVFERMLSADVLAEEPREGSLGAVAPRKRRGSAAPLSIFSGGIPHDEVNDGALTVGDKKKRSFSGSHKKGGSLFLMMHLFDVEYNRLPIRPEMLQGGMKISRRNPIHQTAGSSSSMNTKRQPYLGVAQVCESSTFFS